MSLSEAHKEACARIRYLWRTDDPAWMEQRKADFRVLSKAVWSGASAKEKAQIKRYFLKGEIDSYMPPRTKFISTPYDSPDICKWHFDSECFSAMGRLAVLGGFIGCYDSFYRGVFWFEQHSESFINGVMCHWDDFLSGNYPEKIHREWSHVMWCRTFISLSIDFLKGDRDSALICRLFDFFIRAFETPPNMKWESKRVTVPAMFSVIDEIPLSDMSPDARQLAELMGHRKDDILRLWNLYYSNDD
ncbi:hypothetical protein [Isoalcanivorax pacificus]|uniref:hypothetical protein n=1 Tax=Isoalcanivorax pacificus TaxID=1306787 RepID=UPI001184E788|nr:hypothetical protein [Isoalcanivorax pacificus]